MKKVKFGINANFLRPNGFGENPGDVYRNIKDMGFSCTDFDMSDTESDFYTLEKAAADALLADEREAAAAEGVFINQVHGPWRYPPRDLTEEDRAERFEKMERAIYNAAVLGSRFMVIHPLMPFGLEDIENGDAEKTYGINLEFFKKLLPAAKKHGVIICIENMPFRGFSLSKPEAILRLVNDIDDENFAICLDTGHVNVFADLNIAREARRLAGKIKALHIHDNKHGEDLHLIPGFGSADWKGFGSALREGGFEGVLSVEADIPRLNEEVFKDTCRLLCKILKEIKEDLYA